MSLTSSLTPVRPFSIDRSQIVRTCCDREKHLLFRGWSRLCLRAASVKAAEETSATENPSSSNLRIEVEEKAPDIAAAEDEGPRSTAAATATDPSQNMASIEALESERGFKQDQRNRRAMIMVSTSHPRLELRLNGRRSHFNTAHNHMSYCFIPIYPS